MKKTFRLEGLDCANCAAKMERGIQKIDGVDEVSINFMTLKMTLEAAEEKMAQVIEEATAAIQKIDSHVVVKKA